MGLSLLKSESTNKAIIFSMTLSLFAKIFNFGQSLVVSYAFGTQISTDILFYTVSFIILLTSLVNSINQQVIVPTVIDIRNNISEKDSKDFISYIYLIYLGIGLVGTALLFLAPAKILGAASKFNIKDIEANIDIIKYIIPVFVLIILNTYMLDVFTSYRYFTFPMMLDMAKNILIILFVIVLKDRFEVKSLAMGVLAGNLAQFVILNVLMIKVLKLRLALKRFKISSKVRRNMIYVVAGQIASFINGYITMYLMSGFNAGVYTAMDYSQKINVVLASVVVGQILTVIGMNVIDMYSKKEFTRLNETFMTYFKGSLFLVFPFCFLLALNAENVISIMFERGKFTYEAVKLTSGFFMLFILMIPFRLIDGFVVRLIIAKQIQKISFVWHICSDILQISLIWLMTRQVGYYGYPAGLLISLAVYMFLNFRFMVRTQFEFIDSKAVIRFFVFNGILNLTITGLLYFVLQKLSLSHTIMDRIAVLVCSSMVYAILYIAASCISRTNRKVMMKLVDYILVKVRSRAVSSSQ
ncbi:MAG: hypothetical protein N3B21_02765 [Clostridia bacterium]|nr:hypothetical protein [Clostridia bacterium]